MRQRETCAAKEKLGFNGERSSDPLLRRANPDPAGDGDTSLTCRETETGTRMRYCQTNHKKKRKKKKNTHTQTRKSLEQIFPQRARSYSIKFYFFYQIIEIFEDYYFQF